MTRHRFFIRKDQIRKENVYLSGDQARQINQVLRLRPGDFIFVLNNEGWEFEVELQTIRRDQVIGHVVKCWLVESEPKIRLTLFQSHLKQDKFEWILQKGTELGVASFVPVITERSVIRQTAIKQNKLTRWERIICEAAEQSGRGFLPRLEKTVDFESALQTAQTSEIAMIPWTGEKEKTIAAVLDLPQSQPVRSIALFLGPEGGFSESEIEAAQAAGVNPITLGPRILRAETAAIVATTITMNEAGEMRFSTSGKGQAEI